MKKVIFASVGMMFLAAILTAQAQVAPRFASVGAHGGITAGGDIDGGEPAFGGQARMMLTEHFGFEASLTYFEDDPDRILDMDVTTLGVSALGTMKLAPELNGYALAGVNYNLFSASSPVASVSVDDDFGVHVGGGLGYEVAENWEIFGEYRFTFVETDATIRVPWGTFTEKVSADFGLFKFGVNYLF